MNLKEKLILVAENELAVRININNDEWILWEKLALVAGNELGLPINTIVNEWINKLD